MKIASQTTHTDRQVTNDEALLRCQTALDQKDRGDYKGAQDTMRRLWEGVGTRPTIEGLDASVAADVLLCAGILTGWIGSKTQVKDAQETAKNLISESIALYESISDVKNVAVARTEIAYCYFREGEFNEARIMLSEALQKLTIEGLTRARALLKLAIVEESAAHYYEALKLLTDNAALFEKVGSNITKGVYRNELARTLEFIAAAEHRNDLLLQAFNEYTAADHYFKLARNPIFRASVKNNIAGILFKQSRFREAHKYLTKARRLTVTLSDKAQTAQIDWTRAEVLLAEGKFKEAEVVAGKAAKALAKSGHRCLVAEAMITQGIALARSRQTERAKFIFQKAIDAALRVDASNLAGLAALTLIEEVELPPMVLRAAYQRAREWLADSQSQDVLSRLNKAAGKFVSSVETELSADEATDILLEQGCDLQEKLLQVERELIRQALAQTNGRVTPAAALLGISYQALAYIIPSRHPDLLKQRTPVRRRSRKEH